MNTESLSESVKPTSQEVVSGGVRTIGIIQFGMAFGVIALAVVVFAMRGVFDEVNKVEQEDYDSLMFSLHWIAFGIAGLGYAVALIVPKIIFNPVRLLRKEDWEGDSQSELMQSLMERFFPAKLVRLAAMETPALFGLVVCLVGTLDGTITAQPEYWGNMAYAGVFLAYCVLTFPTRQRVESFFLRRIAQARGQMPSIM